MTILEFFLYFIALLLVTSVAINGVFMASRPHEEIRPDGKVLKNGKILQWWWYFWNKERPGGPLYCYYVNDELEWLVSQIKSTYKGVVRVESVGKHGIVVGKDFEKSRQHLENLLGVYFETTSTTNPDYATVIAYKMYPDFIFPEWVRDMMVACVTCHATVYGNISFWVTTWLVKDEYAWATSPTAAVIVSWIAFWLCLAYLNTWLFQRVKL